MKEIKETLQNAPQGEQVENTINGGGKIEQTPLQINNYAVSKETAALLTCLEEIRDIYGDIKEALSINYSLEDVERGKVGKEIFDALDTISDKLLEMVGSGIFESINILSNIGKYNKEKKTII